jgi:hypothetical protein
VSSNINLIFQSSNASSARDLAKKEERLLSALEHFVNTGPTQRDWLYLKRRWPNFLPHETYEFPFDRVIELNRRYGNIPVDDESLLKLIDRLEVGMSFEPRVVGLNQTVVTFQVQPLKLQDQVRRLWRDPVAGANHVLPSVLVYRAGSNDALREALDLTEKTDPVVFWAYRGSSAVLDKCEDLKGMMGSFSLEIDWARGMLYPKFDTPFQEACHLVLKNSPRARFCQNRACPSPYFMATRATQKYCSGGCVKQIQKQSKLRWWNHVGDTRRKRRKRQET